MNQPTIITTNKNWVEHTAKMQLQALCSLPGIERAVGLPDLHAGKTPIGVAVVTKDIVYPHIIGNDIGCGISLFDTKVERKQMKLERWQSKLNHIRELADLETENIWHDDSPIYDLGTIGGGNHFAEFQEIYEIRQGEDFEKLGINKNNVLLLIHSGSRGYGQSILNEFPSVSGYSAQSTESYNYCKKHDDALLWAQRNRIAVANKLIAYLGYGGTPEMLLDCVHNFLEITGTELIHRKGAVSAKRGCVVIPGSRGTLTYIVKPAQNTEISAYSLSHGAGRKWARSLCKSRIREKYDRDSIRETKLKSRVVCHDTELLYQEAPEAYKNINDIIESLLEYELIEVIATLKPVLTYKG